MIELLVFFVSLAIGLAWFGENQDRRQIVEEKSDLPKSYSELFMPTKRKDIDHE